MKTKNQLELELMESLKPYAERHLVGPNFYTGRPIPLGEMRYHENYLADPYYQRPVISGTAIDIRPIPGFGEEHKLDEAPKITGQDRVNSVLVEFTVKYTDIARYKKQRDWTWENFYVNDPFLTQGWRMNEMVALTIFPEGKILKCRILYTFVERFREGQFVLDGLDPERLRYWAQAMLESAIERTHHKRLGQLFIMQGTVVQVEKNAISLGDFRAYCKGMEVGMFSEDSTENEEDETASQE